MLDALGSRVLGRGALFRLVDADEDEGRARDTELSSSSVLVRMEPPML